MITEKLKVEVGYCYVNDYGSVVHVVGVLKGKPDMVCFRKNNWGDEEWRTAGEFLERNYQKLGKTKMFLGFITGYERS